MNALRAIAHATFPSFAKSACCTLVGAVLCSPPAFGQATGRIAPFLRKALAQQSVELVADTARMPADQFDLRGPPDNLTFGYLTLHIADGNYLFCSSIGDVPAPQVPQLHETDPKQKLIERLKASFDFCTQALASLDDSRMSEQLTMGATKMSRSMAVLTLAGSWITHHDQQQQYLQLAGSAPAARK